MAAGKHKYC